MGGCGSSLRKYGKVKTPLPAKTTSEGQPLIIDAQTKAQAKAQEELDAQKDILLPTKASANDSIGGHLTDERVVEAQIDIPGNVAENTGPQRDVALDEPVCKDPVEERIDLAANIDSTLESGLQNVTKEEPLESQKIAEDTIESLVEESQLETDVEPEPEASKPPVVETWQMLIDRGEVRPDLSWHEAAAIGELKTLEWLQSSADSKELLDLRGDDKVTALHLAARSGRLRVCEWLLKQHADPASLDKTKGTPLHYAALGGHTDVCQLLLDPAQLWPSKDQCPLEGVPDLTIADLWRRTPLFKAAEGGHLQVASLLLSRKAAFDKSDREGETVLHKAAVGNHMEVLSVLLDAMKGRGSLDTANNDGYSPLDVCVLHKQCEAGDLLVDSGAKLVKDIRKKPPTLLGAVQRGLPFMCTFLLKGAPDVGPKSWKNLLAEVNDEGRTALSIAVASGSPMLVERLLQGRADAEASIGSTGRRPVHEAAASGCVSMLKFLTTRGAVLDRTDSNGQNALFYATSSGKPQVCEWLLSEGLSVVAEDDREQTSMHMAARNGHVVVCRMLLEYALTESKCNESELLQASDWEGFEPVHLAIRYGHRDVCQFFLERNAELHKSLDYGITTLQLAAEHGHEEVVLLLLQDLATHEASGRLVMKEEMSKHRVSDGRNAWLLAAVEGHLECCKQFWSIAKDADIGVSVDRHGRDAMLLAAMKGHQAVCKWLLEVQANPLGLNVVDACQWTPLHAAAAEGHREVVKWLLEARGDVGAVDEDGKTARDWAGLKGHVGVGNLLKDAEKKMAVAT